MLPALDQLARMRSRVVWWIAAPCIGPPRDKRACRMRAWLTREGPAGPLVARTTPGAVAIAHVPVLVLIE